MPLEFFLLAAKHLQAWKIVWSNHFISIFCFLYLKFVFVFYGKRANLKTARKMLVNWQYLCRITAFIMQVRCKLWKVKKNSFAYLVNMDKLSVDFVETLVTAITFFPLCYLLWSKRIWKYLFFCNFSVKITLCEDFLSGAWTCKQKKHKFAHFRGTQLTLVNLQVSVISTL